MNPDLQNYINQARASGKTDEVIQNELRAAGWGEADVAGAFAPPVAPPPQAPSVPVQTGTPAPVKSGMNKSLIVGVSTIVLLLAGGAFAYMYFPSLSSNSPTNVLQKMASSILDLKSLEYSVNLQGEVAAGGAEQLAYLGEDDFSLDLKGVVDIHDEENFFGSFRFTASSDALEELINGDTLFGFEIRLVDKIAYLKLLNKIEDLGYPELSFLDDIWVRIDIDALIEQFGFEGYEEQYDDLRMEMLEEIQRIVRFDRFLKITDEFPLERIEGIDAYHFGFEVDEEGLKEMIIELNAIDESALTKREIADIDEALAATGKVTGEIWIGQDDYLPYKLTQTAEVDKTFNIVTTFLFKNHNKPQHVAIPSPVKNIEEIMEQLFTAYLSAGGY